MIFVIAFLLTLIAAIWAIIFNALSAPWADQDPKRILYPEQPARINYALVRMRYLARAGRMHEFVDLYPGKSPDLEHLSTVLKNFYHSLRQRNAVYEEFFFNKQYSRDAMKRFMSEWGDEDVVRRRFEWLELDVRYAHDPKNWRWVKGFMSGVERWELQNNWAQEVEARGEIPDYTFDGMVG